MAIIRIPQTIHTALKRLNEQGFESYVVGGCVRDALLGREPFDWDVTTNALPDEILAVFPDCRTIEIGKQHGTIAVILNGEQIEITTFRTDGDYVDHRRPTSVQFTRSLTEDLARRDFTVNAMAYHPEVGLVDPFHGQEDLQKKLLRTVGTADDRLEEDGLRILRGLRFASQLGFTIVPETKEGILKKRHLLQNISQERIQSEIRRLLCAPWCVPVMREYAEVFFEILPELRPMEEFQQNTPYHCFDVWEHTLHAVEASPTDLILRLTMLLHDCGKPHTYVEDENHVGHFPGHAKISVKLAEEILRRLRFEKKVIEPVLHLVQHHDLVLIPEEKWLRRQLNRFGAEQFFRLLEVHRCDTLAQSERCRPRLEIITQCEEITKRLVEEAQCFQLKDLAIGGRDLLAMGFPPGPKLGQCLNDLLAAVMEDLCPNEREALLHRAGEFLKN